MPCAGESGGIIAEEPPRKDELSMLGCLILSIMVQANACFPNLG